MISLFITLGDRRVGPGNNIKQKPLHKENTVEYFVHLNNQAFTHQLYNPLANWQPILNKRRL